MSKAIARRFTITSTVVMVVLGALVVGFAVAGPLLLASRPPEAGQLAGYVGSLGLIMLMVAAVAVRTARFTSALGYLKKTFPDGAVFLARRHPSVVSDIETFMRGKGFTTEMSDGWVPALVDGRGISAWSTGRRPKELLLMEWSDLGDITLEHSLTAVSDTRPNVNVDVRPFVVPLTVDLGYARGILTYTLDLVDTREAVRITNSLRPGNSVSPAPAKLEAPDGRLSAP